MGLFSRKKKTEQTGIELHGFPGHVDTCKCLYLAAEKGLDIETKTLDLAAGDQGSSEIRSDSPFGKIPSLKADSLHIAGVASIIPYFDIRGKGSSLSPKKAARLGDQNYWIEVGMRKMLAPVTVLIEEHILKGLSNKDATTDQSAADKAVAEIDAVLAVVDEWLQARNFLAVDYSLAEIHWAPYLHFYSLCGYDDRIGKFPNVKAWHDRMKSRESGSRKPYEALPTLEQVRGKELRSVA